MVINSNGNLLVAVIESRESIISYAMLSAAPARGKPKYFIEFHVRILQSYSKKNK